jgi:hypothetical protein
MDQIKQPRCRKRRICVRPPIDRRDFDVQSLQCDQAFRRASGSNYVRRSDVMNDAIHPCAKRTAMRERCHTPPKFDMHLLQQVGPAVGVRLIGSGKPAKESPAEAVRLFVQCVLLAAIHRLPGSIVNHCCPAISRKESAACLGREIQVGSRMAEVPVKWAFFQKAIG